MFVFPETNINLQRLISGSSIPGRDTAWFDADFQKFDTQGPVPELNLDQQVGYASAFLFAYMGAYTDVGIDTVTIGLFSCLQIRQVIICAPKYLGAVNAIAEPLTPPEIPLIVEMYGYGPKTELMFLAKSGKRCTSDELREFCVTTVEKLMAGLKRHKKVSQGSKYTTE